MDHHMCTFDDVLEDIALTKVMLLETRYRVAKMSLSLKTVLNRSGKMQSQGPRK
ncbi:hypothetical protein YC2023_121972 [Brassica napus]